jgi:hypothetical protein
LISKEEMDDNNNILTPRVMNNNDLDRKNKELLDLIEIIELDELISKFKPGTNNSQINNNIKLTSSNMQQNAKSKNSILTAVLNNFDNGNKKKKFLKTNFFHSVWG